MRRRKKTRKGGISKTQLNAILSSVRSGMKAAISKAMKRHA